MKNTLLNNEIYLEPGHICIPRKPVKLYSVVGSGVVITMFDARRKYGGMNHYIKPIREKPADSTPLFACPSIIGLIDMLKKHGSRVEDLEAQVYGGASKPDAEAFVEGLSDKNIEIAFELLAYKKIRVAGKDIGGDRGRKVVFNTATGETIVAKVDRIRSLDWYPSVNDSRSGSFDF
ncbi:chemotaxis protein CheD [Thermodesulfobacteriota bacterium]